MDQELKNEFQSISKEFASIASEFVSIASEFASIRSEFGKIDQRFDRLETKVDVIDFKVDSLKEDIDDGFSIVYGQYQSAMTKLDGFAGTYKHLEVEDVAARSRQDRLEERVGRLEEKIR